MPTRQYLNTRPRSPHPGEPAPAAPARGRRRLWITAACLLAGPLLAEGLLRLLLFHPSERLAAWGAGLREPGLYANPSEDAAYWKLQYAFTAPEERRTPPFTPGLGWLGYKAVQRHRERRDRDLQEHRPVLLFGSSFATCKTDREECFEGLFAETHLGEDTRLLNFGVSGYGLDQVYLLLRQTIDSYVESDPLVVVSFVVESDLDRAALSFRQRPKPLFRVVDGELQEPGPVLEDIDAFLEREPIGITSYLWNYVVYGTDVFGEATRRSLMRSAEKRESKKELCRALMLATRDALEERGLDYFFLLFRDQRAFATEEDPGWKADFVHGVCAEGRIPFVDVRADMLAYAEAHDLEVEDLFLQQGYGSGHPNGIGNRALLGSLVRGLSGTYDDLEPLAEQSESRFRDGSELGLLDSPRGD